ncbi:MAG: HlyC/CorC family transporter [Gemmatimonadetes bacterium]|nr:HlyC/CorC family transporter [Gemmatimonadota bacterium]
MLLGIVLTLIGAQVAYACAAADGALLAIDPDAALPEPMRALHARRERAHRALAFARVMAQLIAGIGVALALDLARGSIGMALALGGIAAVILVGATEALARSLGTVGGLTPDDAVFRFIVATERLLAPVAALGGWFDRWLHHLLPPPARDDEDIEETAEQFRKVVASEAEVSKEQEVLLNGVFRLSQTTVHELMVPRVDIIAVDREAPWSEVVDRVRSAEHARLPVYQDTIDNIVGIIFAKDILPAVVADEPPEDWALLLRPAVFIPAAKSADAQLRDFQASRSHIAIVADEFGGTAGLITIEDVLEEIVGDIRDEYDEDEARIEVEDDSRYWVSGRVTLDELSELVREDLRHEQVETIAGLVYEILGRVPKAGEELRIKSFRVVVERVVRRRIERVYLERRLSAEDEWELEEHAS